VKALAQSLHMVEQHLRAAVDLCPFGALARQGPYEALGGADEDGDKRFVSVQQRLRLGHAQGLRIGKRSVGGGGADELSARHFRLGVGAIDVDAVRGAARGELGVAGQCLLGGLHAAVDRPDRPGPGADRPWQLVQFLGHRRAIPFTRLTTGLLLSLRAALQGGLELPREIPLPYGVWVSRTGGAGSLELFERRAIGRVRTLHGAPFGQQSLVVGAELKDAFGKILYAADPPAEVGVARADARRHLGERRCSRRIPGLLTCPKGFLKQCAAIDPRLVPGLPGRAAEPYEGVAVAPDLLVDTRLDQGLRV